MGLITAMVYKLYSWMNSHKANASAHHAKYTDAEVDAILAIHTAIGDAHHSKYTDAEVDAILAIHTAIADAHHAKYTDAEAVAATENLTCGFYAYASAAQSINNGSWTVIEFNTELFDIGNDYNSATHRFVAPVNGYYTFNTNIIYTNVIANKKIIGGIYVNGALKAMERIMTNTEISQGFGFGVIVKLAADDYVEVKTYHNFGVNKSLNPNAGFNTFSGGILGKY